MNTRDNDPLYAAINAKVAETIATLPKPPDWMRLEPDTPEEERLAGLPGDPRFGLPAGGSRILPGLLADRRRDQFGGGNQPAGTGRWHGGHRAGV